MTILEVKELKQGYIFKNRLFILVKKDLGQS